jgi:flagellar biosynthesis GTPase FlhF
MQNVPTLEEFWAVFTKSQEEAARRWEETVMRREEAAARRQKEEAERRKEEARRQREEAKRQEEEAKRREEEAKRREEETAKRQEEWERNKAEVWELYRKNLQTIDRLDKQMGELHNRFGELAEHLVAPGIISRFNDLGYHFNDTIAERVKILDSSGRKILTEIDLLLQNGDYSIAVEVKSRPTEKDIGHHQRRLEILREHMNRRKDRRKIRGGIAGAVFSEGVKEAVIEAGMYVIEQSGDTMRIHVPEGFKPREW